MMTITTSWDDGDARDMRVADLLDRYGIRGTFYITKSQQNRVTEQNLKALAKRHEVGAHTLTHPNLTTLSREEKEREIVGSKRWLESVTGKEAEMFCYPFGKFDDESKELVKEAGFVGARSTQKTLGTVPNDRFELPVTILTYRAPYTLQQKLLVRVPGESLRIPNGTWEKRAREKFADVAARGGVFHLWGHSWELDKLKLWESLEAFLKEISGRSDTRYLTNGEVVRETCKDTIS